MTITFQLDENDYLEYQLYTASVSPMIKKRRGRNRILIPFLYIFLGVMMMLLRNLPAAISLVIVAVLWFFFYPKLLSRFYKKFYLAHIREHNKTVFGYQTTMHFEDGFVSTSHSASESKIGWVDFLSITEIPKHFLVKHRTGHSYIIPKSKIDDEDAVRDYLTTLSTVQAIPFVRDENWKWK